MTVVVVVVVVVVVAIAVVTFFNDYFVNCKATFDN